VACGVTWEESVWEGYTGERRAVHGGAWRVWGDVWDGIPLVAVTQPCGPHCSAAVSMRGACGCTCLVPQHAAAREEQCLRTHKEWNQVH
jgi:hypothetical protein